MTYRRRWIGDALRRFREERGWTQRAACRRLERSQASLSAYENGHRAIRPRDLRQILDEYGVTDELVRSRLLSLATQGRQDGWWHDFDERLEPGIVDFASLEADASHISIFEPSLVHGLFQSEDYARAVTRGSGIAFRTPNDVETGVDFRMKRQRIHRKDEPPRISVVLGEAALHQQMGGVEVMNYQRAKLVEMASCANIALQILPFMTTGHPGVEGAFTILGVGPDALLEVVMIDSLTRSWYIDEPSDIEHYHQAFDQLQELALSESDSRTLILRIVSGT